MTLQLLEAPTAAPSPTRAGPTRNWAQPGLRFLPAVCAVVAMRIRFVWTPITSDEGGFLAIAREWHGGATLYRDVWVDRPQGLILLYRALHVVGLGTPEGVRMLGVAACIVGAIACGIIAEELFGARAGPAAALVVGVVASVPQYEGFITNGELLSGSIGAAGLALVLRATWRRDHPDFGKLFLGGAVAGAAFTVKQSGFDAFAVGLVAVAWASWRAAWSRRERLRTLPTLVLGFSAPVGGMLVHGAVTGWDRFWYATFGYRSSKRSALRDANWDRFWETWAIARPALVPLLIIAACTARAALRHRGAAPLLISLCWLPPALAAFLLGGQFHRHYWVILAFPLGTIAAGLVSTVTRRTARTLGIGALVLAPVVLTLHAATVPRDDVGRRMSGDVRLVKDEHIAKWFDRHSRDGDTIYALCASAGLYGNTDAGLPFPYLWHDAVVNVPGGRDALVTMLESDGAPQFVAQYQKSVSCGSPERIDAALNEHYRRVATVEGTPILERKDSR